MDTTPWQRGGAALAALVGALALSTADAQAFVRTQTCDPTGITQNACQPGQQPQKVFWPETCLTYHVNRVGSDDFPNGGEMHPQLLQAIKDSFDAWNAQSCSNIQMVYGGLTCNTNVGAVDRDITGGNQNLVIWRDEGWVGATDAIAITTISSDPETGAIRDADIEFNGVYFQFANLAEPSDVFMDVRNTLTHEVGHFVGLDHELSIPEATMYPSALSGELDKRDLHTDDITGLCQIYPMRDHAGMCSPVVLEDQTCRLDLSGEPACSHTPSRAPTTPLALLALAVGLAWRRRER